MSRPHKPNAVLLTAGAFLSFLLFGFVDNIKGPTLPPLLRELGFSYATGGSILIGAYFGFLTATLTTGPIADRLGNKIIMLASGIFLVIGLGAFSVFSLAGLLTMAFFFIGMGLGAIEVGGNLIILDIHQENKGRFLNLLALCHGIGAMLAPLVAGQMLAAAMSWRSVFRVSILPVLLVLIFFLVITYPRTREHHSSANLKEFFALAFNGEMMLYYLVIAIYVAAEIGVGAWLVAFLQQEKGQSVTMSSIYLSLFFGTAMAGRFVGSFFVDHIGYLKSVLLASIAMILFIAIGLFGPPLLSVFIPLSGLFFSIIFPTTTAAVTDLHEENVGAVLGILFMFGGLGAMLGSWSVGVFSDLLGIGLGFGLVLIYCLLLTLLISILMLASRHKKADQ